MAYAIRFKRRARQELDDCCSTYGERLREDIWTWLSHIAASADSSSKLDSIDTIDLLTEALQQDVNQWRYALRRWWDASLVDKVRATLALLRKRRTPWELRFAGTWVHVLGQFTCEVHVHYLVDHVHKQTIFVLFDGLPGQT